MILILVLLLIHYLLYIREQVGIAETMLEYLFSCYLGGIITESEYEEKRSKVISGLTGLKGFIYNKRHRR